MVANPSFYIDDFSDEVMPNALEAHTLEGWAKWLSQGGEPVDEDGGCGNWTFDPPEDGTRFKANSLTFLSDIEIERLPDVDCEPRFRWSRPFDADADFAAIRFGPSMGWGPDDIICDTASQAAIEIEIADECWPKIEVGEEALLAVGRSRNLTLTYRTDPPRLIEETVQ